MVGLSTLMWLCYSYSAKAYLSATAWPACICLSAVSRIIYATYRSHPSRKKESPMPQKFANIPSETFQSLLSHPNTILLDVRTSNEYSTAHLKDAINIDIKSPHFIEEIEELDPKATYLVYCRIGVRSANACHYMALIGFPKLYNLEGGIVDWVEKGFPIADA